MAVVLDTGAVSRGSGSKGTNRERDIRKRFVEEDLIESVLLLPENLFYNTSAPGIIMILNRAKRHPGEMLLINGTKQVSKGRPKNYLTDDDIEKIASVYSDWKEVEMLSAVVSTDEVASNDFNLSPSRYVAVDGAEEVLPLEDAARSSSGGRRGTSIRPMLATGVLTSLGLADRPGRRVEGWGPCPYIVCL